MSPQQTRKSTICARLSAAAGIVYHHAVKHTGLGIVCAVAYFDPGNWGVDLQAGSQYGYKLLFMVLLAGLIAVFWQVQANKLGCVTGLDLASHCRLLLHDRPAYPRFYRWTLLYPLYVLSEVAIISTDLAELLGSAIAIVLLFPSVPLWTATLLTATDVLLLLMLSDPLRSKPVKSFEVIIGLLVLGVRWLPPVWDALQSGALYTSVGILGATIMPHSLFLGSALATQDRVSMSPDIMADSVDASDANRPTALKQFSDSCVAAFHVSRVDASQYPIGHAERENRSLQFVRAHLYHGIVNVVTSLVGLAVCINSLILILAGAVFFYGGMGTSTDAASLFDAHTIIRDFVGKPAATLFAIALLCAGQSASIVATLGGQVVSEGFIHWRVSPIVRRLITRLLGLIPSLIVALAVGRPGINTLLIISQVTLSMVLPFITFPLVWLTSSTIVMRVKDETLLVTDMSPTMVERQHVQSITSASEAATVSRESVSVDVESAERWVDFSNGRIVTGMGYLIWLVMVVANSYVIIALALGQGT